MASTAPESGPFALGAEVADDRLRLGPGRREVTFRDPTPPIAEAASHRLAIATILVKARALPIELPGQGMSLVDVAADRSGIELLFGFSEPVAAVRLTAAAGGQGELVPLRKGERRPVVEVTRRVLDPSAERIAGKLDVLERRIAAAITSEQWREARAEAKRLLALPIGVPLGFFRQMVAGLDHPEGLVRTGFGCNQDCGICWQDRSWGRYGPEQITLWIEDLRAAGAASLTLSGGEPTLDPSLERYIAHARALGFTQVSLETNAIQAAKQGYAERLRDAGLTRAFVSLHSGDAAASDAITRAPGTHARTALGVSALLNAGVSVKLNAVMTREGIDHLEGLPGFIREAFGGCATQPESLMLSYPTPPFDGALLPSILPEPERLREALRATIDKAEAAGIRLSGLDGPCGPPLCAFGADPRITRLKPVADRVDFRHFLGPCDRCAVKRACHGIRQEAIEAFGDRAAAPLPPT